MESATNYSLLKKSGLSKEFVENVVNTSWLNDGYNFSDRIWKRKDKLLNALDVDLRQGLITGKSPDEITKQIADKLETSKKNAKRLVLTESSAIHSNSRKAMYERMGVEKYQLVATLDLRTTEICISLDGKVFFVKDYERGVTAPPFHINCRTTTVPYYDDDLQKEIENTRMARDPKTGKSGRVESLTYKEWYNKYVNGKDTFEREASRSKDTKGNYGVKWSVVNTNEYKESFNKITDSQKTNKSLYIRAKWALDNRDGLDTEELYAIDLITGKEVSRITDQQIRKGIRRTKKFNDLISKNTDLILLHNHPSGFPPSDGDINALFKYNTKAGITVGHDGSIYYYTKPTKPIAEFDYKVALSKQKIYNEVIRQEKTLENLSKEYGFVFKIIRKGD